MNIVFYRLNADQNDLPWQFTVDAYPSIILYPAHRYLSLFSSVVMVIQISELRNKQLTVMFCFLLVALFHNVGINL